MRGYTVPTAFVAIDRYTAPVRRMAGATAAFVNASRVGLAHTERAFRRLMTPIESINRMLMGMGYYVGLFTFIALMRGAIGIIGDFQQAQVDISVVNGNTIAQNKQLATQARTMALTYGEAAKSVSALQLNLIKMGYADEQVLNMTKPIMAASIALKGVPDEVGKTMGAILQAFKIPYTETSTVADLLAKSADLSALDWSDLQTMLPTAMQSANLAFADKQPLDRLKTLLALFAQVRNAQVHVASGSTGIKNMLIDAGIFGKTYQEMLQRIIESPNKLKQAYKLFGRKTIVSALPLADAQLLGDIEDFILNMDDVGYSSRIASNRLLSINGRIQILKSSYQEMILALDDGTGPLAKSIEHYLQLGSAVLLLSAGSEIAKGKLATMDSSIVKAAESTLWWLKVLKWIVIVTMAARLAMFLWTTVVGIATGVAWLWNAAQGMMGFFLRWNTRLIVGNTVAMNAYRFAAWLAMIATRSFSVVMATTPLGWLMLGLGALVLMLGDLSGAYDNVAASADNANMSFLDRYNYSKIKNGLQDEKARLLELSKVADKGWFTNRQIDVTSRRISAYEKQLAAMDRNFPTNKMDTTQTYSFNPDSMNDPILMDSVNTMFMKAIKEMAQGGLVKVDVAAPAGTTVSGDKKFIGNIQPTLNSTFGHKQ
jgi:Phage-related minor tail protein